MLYTLEPHQERVKEYGLKNPYFIMAVDPGGGKSLSLLDLADTLNKKLLIVCPSFLFLNWKYEIEKFFPHKRVDLIRKPADVYDLWDTDIAITTYETSKQCEIIYKWAEIVGFDEAHYLKTLNSQRTEAAHRFVFEYGIERMILMSGTPIKNRVEEYYSLLAMCNYDPRIKDSKFLEKFPDPITFAEHFSFRQEYKIDTTKGQITVVKYKGIKNVNELKDWLRGIYIRVDESEFSKQEPIMFHEIICSEKSNPELAAAFYRFNETHGDENTISAKVDSAINTVPYTIKVVENLLEEHEKVVVYSDHREPAKMIAEHFGTLPVYGGISDTLREKLKRGFQNGSDRVISATIKGFSEGVTLTAAHRLVVNDPSWVPGDMKQVYNRINRMTQTERCHIYQMINSPQSRFIYQTSKEKQKTINLAT